MKLCCAPRCPMPNTALTGSGRVCDNCGGNFHYTCGFEFDENDLSNHPNPDVIRDFAGMTDWCGCDLHPESSGCAPKTASSSPVPGTEDAPGKQATLRDDLWSRLECRAGGTVRLLCNDRHHYVAEVRLPLNLEGFGIFHHKVLPNDMCKVGLVAVTAEAKACGQTAWMDDTDEVIAGTTKLVDMWAGTMLAVPVGCIECPPSQHNSSSAPAPEVLGGDEPETEKAAGESDKTAGEAEEQARGDQEGEGERHGPAHHSQGQKRDGGATHRFRSLGRLKSPADINKCISTEMDKIQKSFTVIYRRTGYELALFGIGDTGGPDAIFKLATPGLKPLITDQWIEPEKTLPAVKRQTQLNAIMQQNRDMIDKGDKLAFSDLPLGAQVHLLKGLLNTALPSTKKVPYGKTSTVALRAMSIQPYGTCAWYPLDVKYQQVDKMEETDRLNVFKALARHAEQNPVLRLALENSIYGDISWDNSMAASFFIVLNREMRTCAADMSTGKRVPPSNDSLVGLLLPTIPTPSTSNGIPTPASTLPRSTTALDTAQAAIKGGWSNLQIAFGSTGYAVC